MIDMHAHLACLTDRAESLQELELRSEHGILTCFSAGTPAEWRYMEPFRGRPELRFSFGIHPWYADKYPAEDCREALEQCDLIGEIGMDSVWCEVPLPVQQRQLERQLRTAADLGKPVLLHTKGQEGRIADIIRGFPGKVCVHWYSGPEQEFDSFLEQGCYFTLGPDTPRLCRAGDGLRLRMVREVPADRLFAETDGVSAIAWARGAQRAELWEIPAALRETLACAAAERGQTAAALKARMRKNFDAFLA